MHIHELNPWRTLLVLSVFVIILVVGFLTMRKPIMTYELDMNKSLEEVKSGDAFFYPWQLDGVIKKETKNVVLFDIRDNFVFGQGHIPGAENMSANDLAKEENIERLEELDKMGITVVLYGKDQLQANGPWMVFRQAGFQNVKVLPGGYQYFKEHKDDLLSTKNDSTVLKGIPQFDYAKMAAPKDGAILNQASDKKPLQVQRRSKTTIAGGGC